MLKSKNPMFCKLFDRRMLNRRKLALLKLGLGWRASAEILVVIALPVPAHTHTRAWVHAWVHAWVTAYFFVHVAMYGHSRGFSVLSPSSMTRNSSQNSFSRAFVAPLPVRPAAAPRTTVDLLAQCLA